MTEMLLCSFEQLLPTPPPPLTLPPNPRPSDIAIFGFSLQIDWTEPLLLGVGAFHLVTVLTICTFQTAAPARFGDAVL